VDESNTPNDTATFDVEKQASQYGMFVNPNSKHVVKILDKLNINKTKYGAPFCPCLNNHDENTICPCKYMREQKACRCGLYVRQVKF
jgi:ferredoxin-thioredoxin reductase catalytic subunit